MRKELRKRSTKLKTDPRLQDTELVCTLLKYCTSDMAADKQDYSDIVGMRLLPLVSGKLGVVGKDPCYMAMEPAVLECLPDTFSTKQFVQPAVIEQCKQLFDNKAFQRAARVSYFSCGDLSSQLDTVLPAHWKGLAVADGSDVGAPSEQWLGSFWRFVRSEHARAESGDDWAKTLSAFDAWPLVPLSTGQLASMSLIEQVLVLPEELPPFEIPLSALSSGGCLLLDELFRKMQCPEAAVTGPDRNLVPASRAFASAATPAGIPWGESVAWKLGTMLDQGTSQLHAVSSAEAESLLHFFNNQHLQGGAAVAFNPASIECVKRLPIFENCVSELTDLTDAQYTMHRPNACGGLFSPTAPNILKHKPELTALYTALGVDVLLESDVFSRFLLPNFGELDAKTRGERIGYIRKNWRALRENPDFIEQMKEAAFVEVERGGVARSVDLYHPANEILKTIWRNEPVFPCGQFLDKDWIKILEELGLRKTIDAPLFLKSARKVEQVANYGTNEGDGETLAVVLEGAVLLCENLCSQFTTFAAADSSFCSSVSLIKFIPVSARAEAAVMGSTASFSQILLPKDWALAFSVMPTIQARFLPPQHFWSRLAICSPPKVSSVFAHIATVTNETLERWAYPIPPAQAFAECFDFLMKNVDEQDLPKYSEKFRVPVGNLMVEPSRMFFKASDDFYPFLLEVPREFAPFYGMLKSLGVRETTSDVKALLLLLLDLRSEFSGHPINPTHFKTILHILELLADSGDESITSKIVMPDQSSVLQPLRDVENWSYRLLVNDSHWMTAGRIHGEQLQFVHPAVPRDLCSKFGVPLLSEVVQEILDPAFEPEVVLGKSEAWTQCIQSAEFAAGVARIVRQIAAARAGHLGAEQVQQKVAPFSVVVVETLTSNFVLEDEKRDITAAKEGSSFHVDAATHSIFIVDNASDALSQHVLAQALSKLLGFHDIHLPLAPLLSCEPASSIAATLDLLHLGSCADDSLRGLPGVGVTDLDQTLLQLRPLRTWRVGETAAWRDGESMRYASVVALPEASDWSGLQMITLRITPTELRSLVATEVYSFGSFHQAADVVDAADTPRAQFAVPAADVGGGEALQQEGGAAPQLETATRAEVARALGDLLTMLQLPPSLDQEQIISDNLALRNDLVEQAAAVAELKAQTVESSDALEKFRDALLCQICLTTNAEVSLVSCGHRFCEACVSRLQATTGNSASRCAFCRQRFTATIPFRF